MMRKVFNLLLMSMLLYEAAFAQAQVHPYPAKNKMSVIFDTDMGNDIDDVLALDMLFKYADQNKIKLLGVMNNKGSEYSTRFLDLMTNWYGYPKLPIGQIFNGVTLNDYTDYTKNMVEMNEKEGFPYSYTLKDHTKLLASHKLYRKLLASQPDHSVVIISVGFSTNLHRLLMSGPDKYSKLNGKDLVAKKVYYLSVMAGSFGDKKRAEFNIVHDLPASRYVFSNWPVGLVLSPFEVGAKVQYPAKSIEEDFGWTVRHPLVDAYKRYRPFPYDRATWDLTSVYYAVEGDSHLLNVSEPGSVSVDEKGFTHFKKDSAGKHYVLSIDAKQIPKLKQYFIDLIKMKPKK